MGITTIATGSQGNCYILEHENKKLIIECGVSFKYILHSLQHELDNVVGCLVTHEHKDHSKAVNDILYYGIKVYMLKATFDALQIPDILKYKVVIIDYLKPFKIDIFNIMPLEANHDVPCVAYVIQSGFGKLLFATDTYNFKYKLDGITHAMFECNYCDEYVQNIPLYRQRVLRSHMSLNNLKKILTKSDLKELKELMLIHISNENGHPQKMKTEIEELTNADVTIADVTIAKSIF